MLVTLSKPLVKLDQPMSPHQAFSLRIADNTLHIDYDVEHPQINPEIVRTLQADLNQLKQIHLKGGPLLKIEGKHSIPMAYVIAHHLSHLYGAIAVFEPETQRYIVSVSHHPDYPVGMMLP